LNEWLGRGPIRPTAETTGKPASWLSEDGTDLAPALRPVRRDTARPLTIAISPTEARRRIPYDRTPQA